MEQNMQLQLMKLRALCDTWYTSGPWKNEKCCDQHEYSTPLYTCQSEIQFIKYLMLTWSLCI